ncbi:Fic family protein [Rhodobacteraceae bacterium F11138]|uniref:Fic family protein n=1 Tax=Rhodobacterales TaxID=204455 RepID=UPI0013C52E8F|nr:Fic family protein [Pseudophaeobacter sp. EL27]MBK0327940.1 Fic family protein [Rhodobacteraceae bacterium F11138]
MEVLDPRTAELAPETQNLFDEVSSVASDLAKKRPFSQEVNSRLSTEFLPDRITASLNMEGISVSRRQTLLMMDAMTLSENSSKAEAEIYNALKADEFIFGLTEENHPLTPSAIRETNKILQKEILPSAGKFRETEVEITGASFQPPPPADIEPLVREMTSLYGETEALHPILRAAWLHATFTRIHPFEDGNGRTGRLLQDYSLLSSDLYPTGIPSSRRDDYYDALEKADSGDWNPLCQMICEFELAILSRVTSILEEVQSRGQFIETLARRASDKKTGGLHKQYVVWKQRMQNFSDQLAATCEELNSSSDILHVRSEKFDAIDFRKWREISETGKSTNTWFLKQTWFSEGEAFYRTIFFFKRHNFRPEDVHDRDDLYGAVSLCLTGGEPQANVRYNFDQFTDDEIRLRELLYINDKMHLYTATTEKRKGRFGPEEIWACEEIGDTSVLVQSFLEDMFVRKLGI